MRKMRTARPALIAGRNALQTKRPPQWFCMGDGMVSIDSPTGLRAPVERGRSSRVSGAIVAVAIVLALLTGSVGAALTNVVRHPLRVAPPENSGRLTLLAEDYYEQLNQLLAGKGSDGLRNVIGAGYTGHRVGNADPENSDDLLAQLDDLHAIFPEARLETNVIATGRDTAVVQVTLLGAVGGSVLGIPVAPVAEIPWIETLRFEGDRLAERWATTQSPVAVEMLGTARYTSADGGALQPRLERVTLDANGHVDLPANTAHLVLVEAGGLRIEAQSGSIYAAPPAVTMTEGETTISAGKKPVRITNSGSAAASFLLLRIENDGPGTAQLEAQQQSGNADQGVLARVILAAGTPTDADPEPWSVSIARVTLQAGVTLVSHQIGGTEFVAVETGELIAVGEDCQSRCVETAAETTTFISGAALLHESQGFSAYNANISYEAAGSSTTTLVLVVISHS
jgi:hypothetical protein